MGYYWLRLVIYIFLCVCIGTIYFKVGNEFSSIMVRSYCTWFLFYVPWHIAKELVLRKFGVVSLFEQGRAGCMSYVAGFLTFMSIGGFPSFVEDMKVDTPSFFSSNLKVHSHMIMFWMEMLAHKFSQTSQYTYHQDWFHIDSITSNYSIKSIPAKHWVANYSLFSNASPEKFSHELTQCSTNH